MSIAPFDLSNLSPSQQSYPLPPTQVPAPPSPAVRVAPLEDDAPHATASDALLKPFLSAADVAVLLQAPSVRAVYAMYERGQLPRSVHPGRRLLFCRTQLLQFLARVSSSASRSRR